MNAQKKNQNQQLKIGYSMLFIVVFLYIVAAVLSEDKIALAILNSWDILTLIFPILVIVIFIMAVINTFVNPKKIAKHLRTDSGFKGWFIAVFSGILSHGPGYIWYPMLADLRAHGVSEGFITAFIYARSIKLPWLVLLVSYFGLIYTVLFVGSTIIGAILQGMILQMLYKYLSKNKAN